MSFFSLNKLDFIILFYCYDITYILSHVSFNEDIQECFARASIVFLVTLNILIAFCVSGMFKNEYEERLSLDAGILESIHQEYKRIHDFKNQSLKILSKARNLTPEEEKYIIFEMHLLDE